MINQKMNKKKKIITQFDVDKQNKKLRTLEQRLQYYINQQVNLKVKFSKILQEYRDSCDILKIKENHLILLAIF